MVLMKDKMRIPLLPNLITTGSIFAGYYSVIHSIQGDYNKAAWAIVIAGVFDNLDGRVARLTKTQSEFGVQYDSMSDLISFGFAPALLAFFWGVQGFPRVGWLASFLYVVCAALRLARFNVQVNDQEKGYFQGLPSPGGAGMICSSVLFHQEFSGAGHLTWMPAKLLFLVVLILLALLMVSGVKFRSFKNINIKGMSPFRILAMAGVVLSLVMLSPELTLFLIGVVYTSSGIIETIFFLRKGVREVLDPDEYMDEDGNDIDTDILSP